MFKERQRTFFNGKGRVGMAHPHSSPAPECSSLFLHLLFPTLSTCPTLSEYDIL